MDEKVEEILECKSEKENVNEADEGLNDNRE